MLNTVPYLCHASKRISTASPICSRAMLLIILLDQAIFNDDVAVAVAVLVLMDDH